MKRKEKQLVITFEMEDFYKMLKAAVNIVISLLVLVMIIPTVIMMVVAVPFLLLFQAIMKEVQRGFTRYKQG